MVTLYLLIGAFALGLMGLLALRVVSHPTPLQMGPEEVARILERFVQGTGSPNEWDDFLSFPLADPSLEAIAARCRQLPEEFPPEKPRHYTNSKGVAVMKQYIRQLREQIPPTKVEEPMEEAL